MPTSIPNALNMLCAGLILISAFAMVATRQVQGVVRFFVIQSLLLAASSFLLGYGRNSVHLWALGAITIAAKVVAIPWILRRLLPGDFYERREISQAVNIPSSLLLALLLTVAAEFLTGPLVLAAHDPVVRVNLPIGLAGVLIGGYSLIARREAIPQLIGILAMENGAFFAGIAIAPELPHYRRAGGGGGRHPDRRRGWIAHAEYTTNPRNHRGRRVERAEGGARRMALTAILALPLLAALLCWIRPLRNVAWGISVASTSAVLALASYVSAEVIASGKVVALPGWFECDGLSALVLLLVSFVSALACVFAGGYMRRGEHDGKARLWWFYSNYNLFVFALLAVPALAEPNLTWVAVELVTLFSVLLVGFDNTSSALEAAWKFAVLTIMGAPIALFGFFTLFWAYRSATGGSWETWDGLRTAASSMDPNVLKLSFLLVFVGFGAKSGLAPMHTWLPDAHSQAPTPVCAVLSGVKTTVPLYVILRFLSIVLASPAAKRGQLDDRPGSRLGSNRRVSVAPGPRLQAHVRLLDSGAHGRNSYRRGVSDANFGFRRRVSNAESCNHEVVMLLRGRGHPAGSQHPRDPVRPRAVPDLALCRLDVVALFARHRRCSPVPHFFERILHPLCRDARRTIRRRGDTGNSDRNRVRGNYAARQRYGFR